MPRLLFELFTYEHLLRLEISNRNLFSDLFFVSCSFQTFYEKGIQQLYSTFEAFKIDVTPLELIFQDIYGCVWRVQKLVRSF